MGLRLLEFGLREKTDRDGKRYLFGAIPEFNCVAFVYDDSEPGDKEKTYTFCVKPYRKGANGGQVPPDEADTWRD